MASANAPPDHASPPHPASGPSAIPSITATSPPPNKRDLKSWWKGFKLPSKHHESQGRQPTLVSLCTSPCVSPRLLIVLGSVAHYRTSSCHSSAVVELTCFETSALCKHNLAWMTCNPSLAIPLT